MVHQVIYVPGLGDSRSYGQDQAIAGWRKFGLQAHYFPLGWADKAPFEPKLRRLLGKIDELSEKGPVSLVGVSAGASAVLNAYAQRQNLNAVVCIGGKINNPQTIGSYTYRVNPAFKQSVYGVADSLKRLSKEEIGRILSIHPLYDGTVPIADTLISGGVEKTVPVIGHRLGIFYTVVFRGQLIANFIKTPRSKK